ARGGRPEPAVVPVGRRHPAQGVSGRRPAARPAPPGADSVRGGGGLLLAAQLQTGRVRAAGAAAAGLPAGRSDRGRGPPEGRRADAAPGAHSRRGRRRHSRAGHRHRRPLRPRQRGPAGRADPFAGAACRYLRVAAHLSVRPGAVRQGAQSDSGGGRSAQSGSAGARQSAQGTLRRRQVRAPG
ncbi:hypothetical protein OY671_010214, partial [Metschnikowia pulcherrima]